MSESLHTHAPHEEAAHVAAEPPAHKHSLSQWVAIFTALQEHRGQRQLIPRAISQSPTPPMVVISGILT